MHHLFFCFLRKRQCEEIFFCFHELLYSRTGSIKYKTHIPLKSNKFQKKELHYRSFITYTVGKEYHALKLVPPLPCDSYLLHASSKSEIHGREVAMHVFSVKLQFEYGTTKTKDHGLTYSSCSMLCNLSRCHQCCKPHPLAYVGRPFQVSFGLLQCTCTVKWSSGVH
jgi:hypothetical protein